MAEKIPRRFRRTLSPRKFEKRVLGRVHLPKERAFLDRVFERDQAGGRKLSESLTQDERKHLQRLDKDIKKNRGSIKRVRLTALLIVAAAVVLFNVLFLDALLERGLESGLEATFRARSDVEGFDLALLAGTVSIERVTVGDRRQPMRNLFESEGIRGELNMPELVKGNVVVHEASFGRVTFGGERSRSARLPTADGTDAGGADGEAIGALGGRIRDAGGNVLDQVSDLADPAALVERELENLQSPSLVDELEGELENFSDEWRTRVSELEERSRSVLESASRVREIEPQKLDSPQRIASSVALVRETGAEVDRLMASAREVNEESRRSYRQLRDRVNEVRGVLEEDYGYLASRFSRGSVDVSGFAEDLARGFLVDLLGKLYGPAQRGVEIARNLRNRHEERAEQPGLARATGREVRFARAPYPRLFLENASMEMSLADLDLQLAGTLSGISSDPQLSGRPLHMALSGSRDGRQLTAEGRLDYHEAEGSPVAMTVSGSGFPFESPAIRQLGVLRAQYRFETDLELASEGSSRAGFTVTVSELDLARAESENIVMRSVQDVIAELGSVDLAAGFGIDQGEVSVQRFSTSADEALREGIASTLAQQRDRYVARARAELERRIEARLNALDPQLSQASQLLDRAEELQSTLEDRDELIARTREELAQRSRELAESQRERVEDRAREEIEKRTEDLDLDSLGF